MEIPRNADSPFDPASHTPDVIIRSSDNVDFYVMKTFLAFSSPDVFGGMFTLPQNQQDIQSSSGLHIVPVTEDSKTLRVLLLYCYPLGLQDEGSDVVDIARAMLAARKYTMDFTEKSLEKTLFSKALLVMDKNPLHIYALACHYGMEELARAAAKKTLELPPSYLSPSPELKHISGMDMYQLTNLRHRCVEAIWSWYFLGNEHVFVEMTLYGPEESSYVWFDSEKSHKRNTSGQSCTFTLTDLSRLDDPDYSPLWGSDEYNVYAATWWSTYFVALMRAIEVCPSRRTVFKFSEEQYYKALKAASFCDTCRPHAVRHLDAFREEFAKALDEIVAKALNQFEFQKP